MSDEWVALPLSELVDRVTTKNSTGVDRVFSVSAQQGLVEQETYFNKRVASKNLQGYWVVQPGDYVFNKSYSEGFPLGVVVRNESSGDGVVSPLYVVMRRNSDLVVEGWLDLAFQSSEYATSLQGLMKEGGRAHGALNVKLGDYFTALLPVPPVAVQRRIVDLMAHLDNHLANLRAEREAAEVTRVAALEEWIDSAGGASRKLGDVLEIARGGSPRPIDDYFTDDPDGLNWIKIGDVPPDGRYITSTAQKISRAGLKKTRQVQVGDFLLSNSMSFGRPYILQIDGCIHDGWLVLSGVDLHFSRGYLYYLLRSRRVQQQFTALAAGSGVKNLNIKVVQSVEVPVPPIEVQEDLEKALSEWFDLVDALDREIEKLADTRAALLSNLLDGSLGIPVQYDASLAGVA